MSFFDTLKAAGLWPQQQGNPYGLDDATVAQARMASLGNLGTQIMALSARQTAGQRANMMQNFDPTGGYQQNLYGAAQMQEAASKRQQDQLAQQKLTQIIGQMPPGQRRDAAMFYLQAGDIDNAGKMVFGEQGEAKPADLKTIRVGNKDITYQWDQASQQWVKFSEGNPWEPPGPAEGPKPSDRLALSKDFEATPEVQAYNVLNTTLGSLAGSINDDSQVSDLDFVYGVAKALDPNSVVRESEGQMVVDSQGMAPSVLAQIRGIVGQGRLTPENRRKLYALVERRAKEYQRLAETKRKQILRIGQGVVGEDDIRTLAPLPSLPSTSSAPPPPGGSVTLTPQDEADLRIGGRR